MPPWHACCLVMAALAICVLCRRSSRVGEHSTSEQIEVYKLRSHEPEQGALVDHDVRRRDKETCKRMRKASETRNARVQLAIAHRRQHRPTKIAVVPEGGAMGAEI